jgi:hypothetical protein
MLSLSCIYHIFFRSNKISVEEIKIKREKRINPE